MDFLYQNCGFCITAIIPLLVCYITYIQSMYAKWRENNINKISELQAIQSELRALKRLILVRKNEIQVSHPNDICNYEFVSCFTSYSYWTVYEGLSPNLGKYSNQDTIGFVISTYTDIKALLEVIKELNKISEYGVKISIENSDSEQHRRIVNLHYKVLMGALSFSTDILVEIGDCDLKLEKYISELTLLGNSTGCFKFWWKFWL